METTVWKTLVFWVALVYVLFFLVYTMYFRLSHMEYTETQLLIYWFTTKWYLLVMFIISLAEITSYMIKEGGGL